MLHDDLFVNASGTMIDVISHNDVQRSADVYHNAVVATGNGIRVSGGDPAYVQRIGGNSLLTGTSISGPNQQDNIIGSYAAAAEKLVAPTAPIGSLDLFPEPGRLASAAIDLAPFMVIVDETQDFDGLARECTFRGANEAEGTSPGWTLALQGKPAPGGTPAPQFSLAVDPTTVSFQGSSTLTWSATRATGCTGLGGSASRSVKVAVTRAKPAPTMMLTASPTNVASGESSSLDCQSTDATVRMKSGTWIRSRWTSGSLVVGSIQSSTNYTLSCTSGAWFSNKARSDFQLTSAFTGWSENALTCMGDGESVTRHVTVSPGTGCGSSKGGGGSSLGVLVLMGILSRRKQLCRMLH